MKLEEVKYYPEFIAFLKKEKVLTKYKDCFKAMKRNAFGELPHKAKDFKSFILTYAPVIWISSAFWWSEFAGYLYWSAIHHKWDDHFTNLINKEIDEKNRPTT